MNLFALASILAALIAADATKICKGVGCAIPSFHETEELGRQLAEADEASAYATDALLAMKPDMENVRGFFAVREGDRWKVYFGRLLPDGAHASAFVFVAPRSDLKTFQLVKEPTVNPRLASYARAVGASALNAAKQTQSQHVNPILLATPSGEFDVYVVQGSQQQGLVVVGGDFHDRWNASGDKLVHREQFHTSLIPIDLKEAHPEDTELAGTMHSHVLIEGPSATDVAAVL